MDEAKLIQRYVAQKLKQIASSPNDGAVKAELARLRRGIGAKPGELPELWGSFLRELPEELHGNGREPSRAEWAIYTAMTLYALHQQGHDRQSEPMSCEGMSLGRALRVLAPWGNEEAEERILRRFNPAATATDLPELAHHLRGLIQLLRAQSIALDYPVLAGELYWMQFPGAAAGIRLRWGQDFYRMDKKEEATDNEKGC